MVNVDATSFHRVEDAVAKGTVVLVIDVLTEPVEETFMNPKCYEQLDLFQKLNGRQYPEDPRSCKLNQ